MSDKHFCSSSLEKVCVFLKLPPPLLTLPVDHFPWSQTRQCLECTLKSPLHTFIHLSILCVPERKLQDRNTCSHTPSSAKTKLNKTKLFVRLQRGKFEAGTQRLYSSLSSPVGASIPFHPLSVSLLEVKRGRTGGCGMFDPGAGGWVSCCFCFVCLLPSVGMVRQRRFHSSRRPTGEGGASSIAAGTISLGGKRLLKVESAPACL